MVLRGITAVAQVGELREQSSLPDGKHPCCGFNNLQEIPSRFACHYTTAYRKARLLLLKST
jgi:hypothetical protein